MGQGTGLYIQIFQIFSVRVHWAMNIDEVGRKMGDNTGRLQSSTVEIVR
jgi:hypothetical protein